MTNLVALNGQSHRDLRLSAAAALREYGAVNVVSVVPREFPRLLAQYPILYTKSNDNGQFEPVALMGFERGENLFLIDGSWEGSYVPLQIQRQPFALLPRKSEDPNATPSLDMALDLDNPHVQSREGERLFQDDGKATRYLETMSSMLSALISGAREAYAFTARLAEHGLLEPVRIDIEFVNRTETKLQGLYWVSATALKALTAEQLVKLRDEGYLEWMYFQMASLAHIAGLVARKNRKLAGVTPVERSNA